MPKQASINAFYVKQRVDRPRLVDTFIEQGRETFAGAKVRYANFLDRMCGISAFCMQNII